MTPIRKGTARDDIIAAIDHATGCQQCGKDLSGSVSDDFCKEECQRAWQAANVARVQLDGDATAGPISDLIQAYRLLVESGRLTRQPATHFTVHADGTFTQNLPLDARHAATRAVQANAELWLHHRFVGPFHAP